MIESISAYAKLNLFLDVRNTREDGLHELVAVNHEIDLCDEIFIEFGGDDIRLTVEGNPEIPTDESNLIVKAVRALESSGGKMPGMSIRLDKRIPTGAGLGGGSADAAVVLKHLNECLELDLSQTDLVDIGSRLGADVPFALMGGTALVTGAGEGLERLPDPPEPIWFIVGDPGVSVNTGQAYRWLDEGGGREAKEPDEMLRALEDGDLDRLARALHNSFESVIFGKHPRILALRDAMLEAGAIGSAMTGSGSNVFGIVRDRRHGREVLDRLTAVSWNLWLASSTRP